MEFQPGKNTTSVVVGIVDDDVYGHENYLLNFRLFILNDDFVEIGPKSRLQILVFDDEVYTVEVMSFTDFVTEGDDAAAVLVLDFQEPPGGSSVTPRISTIVRVTGGSASKLNLTSHLMLMYCVIIISKIYSFSAHNDYRPPHIRTRK